MQLSFQLNEDFIQQYRSIQPDFGYNGLGLVTYLRTYSRLKDNGNNEQWFETIQRVVEGCYSLQKDHILSNELGWNDSKAQRSAQEMYDRMFTMKFLPPGRMLWAMGTPIIHERKVGQALFNCAFVSTKNIGKSIEEACQPFTFMMDMSMVGVGVGFDVDGATLIQVNKPLPSTQLHVIPDTREGWVDSLFMLLQNYFNEYFTGIPEQQVSFDYSQVRPAGLPIKGFGGISSGPAPLVAMHDQLRETLNRMDGQPISITDIADIMNMIGQCVVAGNVRRTAQIALGSVDSQEYRQLKDYKWDAEAGEYKGEMAHRAAYGWASNNSVLVDNNTNFVEVAKQTAVNGEPGYIFMDNIRAYSRMGQPADYKDHKAVGTNPCGEQSLESYELCCLVETFPSRASSLEDYLRTLKFAYMVGKTATLVNTTWHQTNRVQKRNRRIGTSVTGVTNFIDAHSLDTLKIWLEKGYDEIQKWDDIYASWLCVPRSIKSTSVKPSGTVSLLAGVNPGCHFPEFTYYIRRVRLAKTSSMIATLKKAGLHIEDDVMDPSSVVVSFPVHNKGKSLAEVSIWEQVNLAIFLQEHWSDNQVSCTVTFKPEEANQIAPILDYHKYHLKSISFLPKLESGAYAQMPYEAISKEKYAEMKGAMGNIELMQTGEDVEAELFCNNDTCVI
ncbi:MAG: fused protease/ribonucleoside-triphosphate reductase [Flavobacteriales bacterium]|nr:fused protease/ribonucleoside-triphosphate reductase [Flavobacteriales bacterium]MBT4102520.1 fused protease/ribonucleoside-triphosphate reductase [Flavobacteriales bacterium]MBT4202475.1 fused protease/ribonucleoside-triphosphate reductase [Flavobacteriales bacterium]MBT5341538.1 fused protease/ribonucleoside-triphosphate reductase [Flavobacteriales bacterium]MBT5422725.1 fused protease/ribonucleoside-triphosphate reductase [Flavobacteriales bacterium]